MIYLRLFEDMNTDGYEPIDVETYIDGIRPEYKVPFKSSDDEYIVRKLVDVGKKYGFTIESNLLPTKNANWSFEYDFAQEIPILTIYYVEDNEWHFFMTITKCDDKWFYINDGVGYYKCDDVEGIVSCFDVLCKVEVEFLF